MGFGGGEDKKMQGQRHKRSKSFPEKKNLEEDKTGCSPDASQRLKLDLQHSDQSAKTKKKLSPNVKVHSSLKQEILQLEKRLQNQFDVRRALEKALGYKTSSKEGNTNAVSSPKPATELIKEIAVLELEVSHLEQYLLSLYRKAFDQQMSSVSPTSKQQSSVSPKSTPRGKRLDFSRTDVTPNQETSTLESRCFSFDNRLRNPSFIEKELDSNVRRCQSSLNQRSNFNNRISPPEESLLACHSQPLSMKEYMQNESSMISLAEHLGTRISDHVPITPNKLSEDMIKCASAIYCKLADPPVINHGLSSPSSSPSSASEFSPHEQYDMWSPSFRKNSSFDVRSDNQFEFSGPYSSMVEVSHIYRNRKKGRDLDLMLRNFSLLISQLEGIDPRKLTHQEKMAFWINVHNALVMHTFLAYGIPQNNGKRFLLFSKPAYNIGGHVMSVETIQSSILRSRLPRPGQWLRLLLTPRKFRTSDEQQEFSLDHAEPLLYFALCSGSHSDPAIRVYTPKRIYQELETAKEEFIRATFGLRKDQKILVPKIIESFSKDSTLSQAALLEMIHECLPETSRKTIKKFMSGKPRKSIVEWIPHNFSFRYLISKELIR